MSLAEQLIEEVITEQETIHDFIRPLERIARKYRGKWYAQAPGASDYTAYFNFTVLANANAFAQEAKRSLPVKTTVHPIATQVSVSYFPHGIW